MVCTEPRADGIGTDDGIAVIRLSVMGFHTPQRLWQRHAVKHPHRPYSSFGPSNDQRVSLEFVVPQHTIHFVGNTRSPRRQVLRKLTHIQCRIHDKAQP